MVGWKRTRIATTGSLLLSPGGRKMGELFCQYPGIVHLTTTRIVPILKN
jgi:hypothetical protein